MPIRWNCPQCKSSLALNDQAAGKMVRCKKCQTVSQVPAASPSQDLDELEIIEPSVPQAKSRKPKPEYRDEPPAVDDEFSAERPKKKKSRRRETDEDSSRGKKPSPVFLALVGFLLVAAGGGGAAYFLLLHEPHPAPVAQNFEDGIQEPGGSFADPLPMAPSEKTEEKKEDNLPNPPPPVTEVKKDETHEEKKSPAQLVEIADVAELLQYLGHEDREIRKKAIERLGQQGKAGSPAFGHLFRAMELEQQPDLKAVYLAALAKIPPRPEDADLLIQAGLNLVYHVSLRLLALQGLEKIGPPAKKALPSLMEIARGQDVALATQALRSAKTIGPGASEVTGYVNILRVGPVPLVHLALDTLAGMGEDAKTATPTLMTVFRRPDRELKLKVIHTLGQIGPTGKETEMMLTEVMRGPDRDLAVQAAFALSKITETRLGVPFLTSQLKTGTLEQRKQVVGILAKLGPEAKFSARELTGVLENDALLEDAKAALIRIGKPGVNLVAQKMLVSPKPQVRLACIQILMEIQHSTPEVAAALMRVMENDPVDENKTAAMQLLDRLGVGQNDMK